MVISGIGELVTNDAATGDGTPLGLLRDAALVIEGERVGLGGTDRAAPAADVRVERGRRVRASRLRRLPRPPGLRRRPGGGVQRPDGRPAATPRAGSAPRSRPPAPPSDGELALTAARLVAEMLAPGHDHRGDQVRVRPDRRGRGARPRAGLGPDPRDHLPRGARGRPRSTRTTRPAMSISSPARCSRPAHRTPGGSTCSASAAPSTRTPRGRSCGPARVRGSVPGCTPTSSDPVLGRGWPPRSAPRSADHCTHLDDADVTALATPVSWPPCCRWPSSAPAPRTRMRGGCSRPE